MSGMDDDDPTVPPPGRRNGAGLWSIVPYLKKSLAAKPQALSSADEHPEFGQSLGNIDGDRPSDSKAH